MAILVKINKVKTVDMSVTYSFTNEYGQVGIFVINSITGGLDLTTPMPTDSGKAYFARAARKVITDWKAKGVLPDKAVWSS